MEKYEHSSLQLSGLHVKGIKCRDTNGRWTKFGRGPIGGFCGEGNETSTLIRRSWSYKIRLASVNYKTAELYFVNCIGPKPKLPLLNIWPSMQGCFSEYNSELRDTNAWGLCRFRQFVAAYLISVTIQIILMWFGSGRLQQNL